MTPSNLTQFSLIVAFIVPGVVYQTVRARYLGEVPQNRDQAAKVLRALAASTLFALLYAIVFAQSAATIAAVTPAEARAYAQAHAGRCAWWSFILIFAAPSALGCLVATWPTLRFHLVRFVCWLVNLTPDPKLKRIKRLTADLQGRTSNPTGLRSDTTPTAWDWAVDHGATSNGFVRIQDGDGEWWGGAFGNSSYFSDYPEDPAVFVEVAWTMSDSGEFLKKQESSRGAWIPCKDARVVQFLAAQ